MAVAATRPRPRAPRRPTRPSARPASTRHPDSLKGRIKDDELRLYRLIWQRALASQMAQKQLETTAAELEAGRFGLRASATRTTLRRLHEGLHRGSRRRRRGRGGGQSAGARPRATARRVEDVEGEQHFTEPPPRFTEATLIKALEEHGIGRPSTYAATISTIQDRGYVKVVERRLHPEVVAGIVTDVLVEHFGDYVDLEFTARMEAELDEIAEGKREWVPLLREFYDPLIALVDEKRKTLTRKELTTEETDEVCSEGHPMVIRLGRNGRFLACSMYPDHKETRDIPGEEPDMPQVEGAGEPCPKCKEGELDRSAWSLRRLRGLQSLSGLRLHPPHRATASAATALRGRAAPSAARAGSPPVARAAPATSSTAVVAIPSATSPPTSSRSARSTTPTTARSRSRTRAGICLKCGAERRPASRPCHAAGQKLAGGHRTRRRWRPPRKTRAPGKAKGAGKTATRKRKTTKSTSDASDDAAA